jgi:hypothetical protein
MATWASWPQAGAGAAQDADHARLPNAGANLEAEGPQMIGDHARRAGFGEAQLRVLMQVAAPGDDLGHDPVHGGRDRRLGNLSRSSAPGRQNRERGGQAQMTGQAANDHDELPFVKFMLRKRTPLVQAVANADLRAA